jgi:hypothetical protein
MTTKICTRCGTAPRTSSRHQLCDACRESPDRLAAKKRTEHARWRRNHERERQRIADAMPDGWEDMLQEALHEVLHEHDVTLAQLVGRSRSHQMMSEPDCVPTIKSLAPRLRARGIKLSTVILRAESKWG